MFSWLLAKFYDRIMADAEERCLHIWRQSLLKNLSGKVLELGCGTGANLEFYPSTVKQLVVAEPCGHMQRKLQEKLMQYSRLDVTTLNYDGTTIPVPNDSFDVVVSTLVLCSVSNQSQTLSEIYRVLKPEGKLFFIEHIAAVNNPKR